MTEEIKEILDDIKIVSNGECARVCFDDEQCDLLLNYITNLQKEKEELQRKYLTINENNQNMQEEMARTWKKCDDYKQRNEKAVEYIKQTGGYIENISRFKVDVYEPLCLDLLNILQGGDE